MKPHLPTCIFRAIMSMMVIAPSALYAAYTAPTEINIPGEYNVEQEVITLRDMADYSTSAAHVAFRVLTNIEAKALSDNLMHSGVGSRYFTSRAPYALYSLNFLDNTYRLFNVSSDHFLEFVALKNVNFSGNEVSSSVGSVYGGVIYGSENSTIRLNKNEQVSFVGNKVSFTYNSNATYDSSTIYAHGGAIYGDDGSSIEICNNGMLLFEQNAALASSKKPVYSYASGGAVLGDKITINNNDSVTFSQNTVSDNGGAILGLTIKLNNNGIVKFIGNKADAGYAGAIRGNDLIELNNNDEVIFNDNVASSYGGAIYGSSKCIISLSDNGKVVFSNNHASRNYVNGGAICGWLDNPISLNNNGIVVFDGNVATSSSSSYGGAIHGGRKNSISLNDNGIVTFNANKATNTGGAIYGGAHSIISLNKNGTVTFSENSGGAIYLGKDGAISLNDNDNVIFRDNKMTKFTGGAIYTNSNLDIRNNGSVEFAGNVELSGGTYRLRSIHASGEVSLSAAEGKSITFRDSIYTVSGYTVSLNADYNAKKQKGDILFTGATTEADLLAVKGSAGTAEEIMNSRTSEVNAVTKLYGGRLRVEDGAVYKGQGITVHEYSDATVRVKDATLNHKGYSLTFASGTTLETEGSSSISGAIVLAPGAEMNVKGSVTLDGGLSLSSADTVATLQDVTLFSGSITGTGEDAVVKDVRIQGTGASHTLKGVKLENVQFASSLTLLELTDVEFDDACMFSVGAEGTIVLNDALLCVTLPELGTGNEGVLYLDCTQLFHCTVEGDLKLSLDTAAVRAAGYSGLQLDFGSDANYETLTLNMNGATYTGNVGTMATFDVVPEPATATLSLLALAALASRRRRA